MAELLKGMPVAKVLTEALAEKCGTLKAGGIIPSLAIVRVGENPGDLSYERGAVKRCETVGIEVKHFVLDEAATTEDVLAVIRQINGDPKIHGCLMFRPLPKHMDEQRICEELLPEKDVDCMTSASLSGIFTGRGAGFAPCTADACIELLKHYAGSLKGKNVTVIGRSLVIGKPVAMLLLKENATVTVCHTGTADMAGVCRRADILIAAAGKAGLVTEEYTNPGQYVIDVGINEAPDGGICGDVAFSEVEPKVAAISPVPGGVGSVTTAVLCKHVIAAAER